MLQNPKIRSLSLGAMGALIGSLFAEVILGEPDSLSSTGFYGIFVGTFVGGILGSAEFLLAGNLKRMQRAAPIALLIGAVGGGLGASCGQFLYQATNAGEVEVANNDDETSEVSGGDTSIFRRIRQAGGKEGAIEIGLEWNDTNDLDLHVVEPSGNRIYFKGKRSTVSDGHLDVDRNADCANLTASPVEHIYWDSFDIPDGTYKVFVHFYSQCGASNESEFTVLCKYGDELKTFNQTIAYNSGDDDLSELIEITSFSTSDLKDSAPTTQSSGSIFQIIGWGIFGLLLGVGVGAPKYSFLSIRNASLGGLVGGLMGGVLFVFLTDTVGQNAPMVGRLIGIVVLGALIGVMIAIVESALSAGLKFISGPFEGREMLIVRPQFTIGRHELEDEYIGGDTSILAQHASVKLERQRHLISPLNGAVSVNGTSCSGPVELCNGDRILIGATTLIYRWRVAADESPPRTQPSGGGAVKAPSSGNTDFSTPPPRQQPPVETRSGGPLPPPPPKKKTEVKTARRRPAETKRGNQPPPPPPPRKK